MRRGAGALRPAPIAAIEALRLLIVWANPDCAHWGWADVERDLEAILQGLRGVPRSHLQVEVLAGATVGALQGKLAAFRPHLLHFTGHGGYPDLDDPGDLAAPSLVLEGEPGGGCHAYLPAAPWRGSARVTGCAPWCSTAAGAGTAPTAWPRP